MQFSQTLTLVFSRFFPPRVLSTSSGLSCQCEPRRIRGNPADSSDDLVSRLARSGFQARSAGNIYFYHMKSLLIRTALVLALVLCNSVCSPRSHCCPRETVCFLLETATVPSQADIVDWLTKSVNWLACVLWKPGSPISSPPSMIPGPDSKEPYIVVSWGPRTQRRKIPPPSRLFPKDGNEMARCALAPWPPNPIPSRGRV